MLARGRWWGFPYNRSFTGTTPPLPLCGFSPEGRNISLVLWDRRHKTVLSGFMGISSVGYAATFPSGEGFYSPLRWRGGTAASDCEAIEPRIFDAVAVGEMHHTDALSWGLSFWRELTKSLPAGVSAEKTIEYRFLKRCRPKREHTEPRASAASRR